MLASLGARTRVAAMLLVGAGAVGACAGRGFGEGEVVFGAAGPWSEGYGAMNKRGIELAVAEINAAGGIHGRRLRLLARDDDGSGEKATSIAQEFVANADVVAVVGHVNSGAMVAAARMYDGHLVSLATTATSPDLSGISPWVFRVISSDSANGLTIARFARRLGRKRAAILYENNAYGRGLTESFRRNFDAEVVSVDPISEDTRDCEPYVAFLKRYSPDVVFVAGTERSGIAVLREARRQGLRADFVGGDGWTGIVDDTAAAEGAYVAAPFTAEDPRPDARRFVSAFRQRYHGLSPDGNAALAYDATMLLARAVTERGTDRAAVRDYLASLARGAGYPGVTGAIRFEPSGDPLGRGMVMTRVERGALTMAEAR
ncbi:MAG: ABC transporter substrate-binding protein [Gemmatimonadaceae bacterium]